MKENSISRDELMASFHGLQEQFDQQRSDIRDKEEVFDQAVGADGKLTHPAD
ncbi:hypothetical protein I4938_28925 [Pseudomonas aeruginosa]|nr:hypothetical protein [Pseudomonas aeruginosa]